MGGLVALAALAGLGYLFLSKRRGGGNVRTTKVNLQPQDRALGFAIMKWQNHFGPIAKPFSINETSRLVSAMRSGGFPKQAEVVNRGQALKEDEVAEIVSVMKSRSI
jgi:hypothetical protein